ncbi:MAG: universal stress protein [Candidatus Nitrotoga sp.]
MKRFKDILCVVELEGVCEPILERAVALAENNQASLTVVDVVERVTAGIGMSEDDPASADLQGVMVNSHKQQLDVLVEPYSKRIKLETKVLVGTPFLEIIREVLRNGRDLVIKLPEHQDWLDRLFGSDDMNVLRQCPCPVWLIKPQEPKAYRRILAAVDVDDTYPPQEVESRRILNRQILEMASSLALAESAELHIVHAWDAIGESDMRYGAFMRSPEEKINAYVEEVRRQHAANLDHLISELASHVGQDALGYLKHQMHLVKGWARKEIPALAKSINADIVVMGTVGRTGVPGFIIGNTAETILSQIDCSVLAIKPLGFESPVTLEN